MKSILRSGLAILLFIAVAAFPQQRDLSKEKVLYTMGYAHLDTEWRWDYQTTINEYIWNTMVMNFRLLEKYPHYVFNFSGANRYKMMKEYYPKEYETVKKWVAAGRWFPSGSSMEENDALAVSHESIIRQILLGGEYFRKEFGISPKDYILPDCFGFPASLPSILAHCGIKGFSTQKLTWGSNVGIPFNVGTWFGPDGESIVAALNPGSYGARVQEDLSVNESWRKRILDLGAKTGVYADYMYYGTGDVGGSPTEESVQNIEKSIANSKDIKIISAKGDEIFNDITPAQKAKLPSYTGEFLLTNHSAGSITSAAYMKRLNRKNELLGLKAEAAASMGDWLGGLAYDKNKMNEAWRLVMGGQFHDILPGTSIPRAYEFAWNDGLVAANQFANILTDASGAVARAMDTQAQGVPLVVFNPLGIDREDIVEASATFTGTAPKAVKVYGRDGKEMPSQVVKINGGKVSLLFLAELPSLGYASFDIRPSDAPCSLATGLKVTASSLENSKYVVKLNAGGDVVSIYDKTAKKELLAAPHRLEFHYEKPEQWPAWNQDWEDRIKPPLGFIDGAAKIRIVENGPARVALEVEREARHSKVVQSIRLAANGERVEFATAIDWATHESSLKAAFPLTVSNPQATYSFGVGTVQRGNNEPVRFEVPSHQWFDLTHKDGRYGVSVLEDCKYGSDKPADNIVRLTLMFTPGVRTSYREQRVQDFGKHEMIYALYGHKSDWRAGDSNLQGSRLNQPLVAFQTVPHAGPLGKAFSFLSVNNRDVVVSAVKKAENEDELIVRIVEAKGKAAKGIQLSFAAPVVSAREVTGQEQELGPAAVKNGKLVFDITPYHLRTFALKLKPAAPKLGPARCAPVDLPYNRDIISFDEHKADGDFDGRGRSFPAEMLPDVIRSESIEFKVGPKADGANNAVSCQGQTIKLPAGNFNKLYILAAATDAMGGGFRGGLAGQDAASRSAFKMGGASVTIPIEVWSGYYGQWDRRLWEGVRPTDLNFDLNNADYSGLAPAYVRKDNIAYFTTHRHLRTGDNEAYAYAYIYKYKIDLPAGAQEITLPTNDRYKILAMTAAASDNDATTSAQPLYDTLARNPGEFVRFAACSKPIVSPEKSYIDYGRPLTVVLVPKDENAEIRYTLDGTDPTPVSTLYAAPLSIGQSAVLKAAAFDKVKLPSAVSTAFFSRSLPVRDIQFVIPLPPRRGGAPVSGRALVDLARAAVESYDRNWLAIERTDLDVILDLGQVRTVEEVSLGCLENHNARIFAPASVEISVSADNKDFKTAASEVYSVPETIRPIALKTLANNLNKVQARYVRVKVKNIRDLPKWHKSAASPNPSAIMYFDEIIVK